jgi:hypothetical protein
MANEPRKPADQPTRVAQAESVPAPSAPATGPDFAGSPPPPSGTAVATQGQADANKSSAEKAGMSASAAAPTQSDSVKALADALVLATRSVQAGPQVPTATEGMDQTIKGGKFLVEGKLVNAHGREIDEEGNILHPEQLQQDMFGRLV